MMRTSFLASLLCVSGMLLAAPVWEDESINAINREPARASLMPTDTNAVFSLNGMWNFHFSMTPEARAQNFWEPSFDVSDWNQIEVPLS
jgi:beta-galactosidase